MAVVCPYKELYVNPITVIRRCNCIYKGIETTPILNNLVGYNHKLRTYNPNKYY